LTDECARVLLVRKKLWNVVGKYVHEVFPVCMSVPLLVIHTNYVLLVLAEVYMMIVLCSCSLGWSGVLHRKPTFVPAPGPRLTVWTQHVLRPVTPWCALSRGSAMHVCV